MSNSEYSISQNEIVNNFITKKLILKEEEYKIINDFINSAKHMKLKLLYSTAVADYNSMTFHRLCNGMGPTLTVVKATNGKRFGGYASVSWRSMQQYVRDDDAFLFSLDLKKCFKKKSKCTALFDHSDYGPTFGEGHDLHISNTCKVQNGSSCNAPNTYSEATTKELSGEKNFVVEDYEVYSVIMV